MWRSFPTNTDRISEQASRDFIIVDFHDNGAYFEVF